MNVPSPKAVLVALVMLVLVIAATLLFWQVLKLAFYRPQDVVVERIEALCSRIPQHRRRSWFEKPRQWTDECSKLLKQNGGRNVARATFLSFTYRSPADGEPHAGTLQRNLNDAGQAARTGDRIAIEASWLLSDVFTDWSSPSIAPENIFRGSLPDPN
ncbi:hypothetical protein [Neorhizobium alkalisoli]|uniref:Uncharacterized protein n=1 Tax=Neorhizobium alkalisoli TaxID=528178 RepID=A0A561R1G8_9HYPH|nr:hypothetical protein [Neorhizobium alkalisoli]TWF56455.1 hypothetical protein FHW37_10284 [Neorhizobium alkalisoli]